MVWHQDHLSRALLDSFPVLGDSEEENLGQASIDCSSQRLAVREAGDRKKEYCQQSDY